MPALAPVPSVLNVRLLGSDAADNKVGSRIFIKYSSAAPTVAQLDTFCTAVGTAWATDIAPLTNTNFTLDLVEAADLTSATAASGLAVVSHAGTRTGTELPLNVAFSLQYVTSLRRRGGHWHGQWRFGSDGDLQTVQTWTTAFVSAVESGFLAFITAVEAAVWSGGGALGHVGVQYYGPPNRTITGSTGRVRTVSTALVTPNVYVVSGYNAFTRLGSAKRRLGKSGT